MYKAARYTDDDDGKLREHDAAEYDVIRALEDAFPGED